MTGDKNKREPWTVSRLRAMPEATFYKAVILLFTGTDVSEVAACLTNGEPLGNLQGIRSETLRKYLTKMNQEIDEWHRNPSVATVPKVVLEAGRWLEKK